MLILGGYNVDRNANMLFTVFGFYSSDNDDPNNYEFNPHPY